MTLHSSGQALAIETIRDLAAFEALREDWNSLVAASATSSIFLSHEWVGLYWKYFAGARALHILAIYDEARRLIGLAPLCIRARSIGPIPLYRRAEFVGVPFSDVLDVIAQRGCETRVVRAVLDELVSRGMDTIDLAELPDGSPVRAAAEGWAQERGLRIEEETTAPLPYVSTIAEWPSYLASLGKSTQRHWKYYTNRLTKKYRFEFAAHREIDAIEPRLDAFFDLYAGRFRDVAPVASPAYRRFREDVARVFSRRGWMVLFTLTLDGALAAAEWCFVWDRALLSYNSCYDAAWSKDGVTTVFQGHILRYAIEQGFREYDFLRGDEGYKSHWATGARVHHRIQMTRSSLRTSMVAMARGARIGWRDLRNPTRQEPA